MTINSKPIVILGLILIFFSCCFVGYQLSTRKVLWNDEAYTQVYNVQRFSYGQMLAGDLVEGNNSPLYYVLQKSFLSLFNYHFPYEWSGDGRVYHLRSQVLMRSVSNVCVSLAIVFIVGFFWTNSSFPAAVLALLTSISSMMVLSNWAEARPYALWFLLSVAQLLIFIHCVRKSFSARSVSLLAFINCLLGLTTVLSIGQIVIFSCLAWKKGGFKATVVRCVFLFFIPLLLCVYYFWKVSLLGVFRAYKVDDPAGIFNDVFALDRLWLIILIFVLGVFISGFKSIKAFFKLNAKLIFSLAFLFLFGVLFLIYYKLKEVAGGYDLLSSRYLIFLTPYEIIASVYGIIYGFRLVRERWGSFGAFHFVSFVSFFYIIHAILIYKKIYGDALFAYN